MTAKKYRIQKDDTNASPAIYQVIHRRTGEVLSVHRTMRNARAAIKRYERVDARRALLR